MEELKISKYLREESEGKETFIFDPNTLTELYKEIAPGVYAKRTKPASIELMFM